MSLDAVLEAVPELHDAVGVEPLAGGLTNTNYKVTAPAGAFVVRISGKDTGLLAIDRANEVHNTRCASDCGVGARFVAALPEHDALVLEFIDGEVMNTEKLQRGDRLGLVAAACRRLHGAERFLADFDMFEIQRGYLAVVRERGFRLPDRYDSFEPQVRALEQAMRASAEPTVPCNNDLLAENFIHANGEMRLIDYEYSGNNEPSFELGNVWSESNLSLAHLEELVAEYYGQSIRSKVARARLWGLMSKYGWTLWASIQDGISDLDFDFWGWGMEKYDRAVAEFDSPDFERLLAKV
ncbi:MAG: phosphotransferase family protein [Actinomycetota bacterium]|nr:phosphotransferase family protein [Actinomycetota bacterium]